jgi:uracil-DNA glycosylase|tara:strand:- start:463 stop:1131 length:669 start_codon:yes stop_codon:yes gene_type:complete
LKVNIEKSWLKLLDKELNKKYFNNLIYYVKNQYKTKSCYPPRNLIFSAFDNCNLNDLKVVIIGQDPYHGPGQANGLCFSVDSNRVNPPSLNNIFKEISHDLDCENRDNGNLIDWAKQGVMLLNSVLTVEDGLAGSHANKGWEKFTNNVIKLISENKQDVVFMLWGGYAKKKESIITNNNHLILKSGHPSPLSANRGYWFGNKHFSKCNDFLIKRRLCPIKWL